MRNCELHEAPDNVSCEIRASALRTTMLVFMDALHVGREHLLIEDAAQTFCNMILE